MLLSCRKVLCRGASQRFLAPSVAKVARLNLRGFLDDHKPPPSNDGKGVQYMGKVHDLFDPTFLDESGNRRISVRGYGETSFKVDDTLVRHSVILMPHSFLMWNAKTFDDITLDTLYLFPFLFPAVEIVFVGCGENMPRLLPPEIYKTFRAKGIVIEATNTINAAASFNILNAEGRNVCAALLTLQPTTGNLAAHDELI
jgi:uncharacterized protein